MIFETIEEARENLEYAFEDLNEVQEWIAKGKLEMALNVMEAIIRSVEWSVNSFRGELEARANEFSAQAAPVIQQIIAASRN